MSQAAPRTAPAWKLFRTVLNANSGSNSAAWRYLLEKLEPIKQKEAKIEQALREQFAYERSDHGLIRITHDSDGISTADVKPEQYGYLLYGKKQKKLDALFDKLGAEWVNKRVQELLARYPTAAAEMGLAELLVQAAPAGECETPSGADQTPKRVEGKDAPDDDKLRSGSITDSSSQQSASDDGDPSESNHKRTRLEWMAHAMLTVKEHPDWSDREIAKSVKINPSQLSRCKEYQVAASLARSGSTPKSGFVRTDDRGKRTGVDAVDEPSSE